MRNCGRRLVGFGVIRACRQGHKIGPLYGDTRTIAAKLFDALIRAVPENDVVMIDTPAVNTSASRIAVDRDFVRGFETARMYTAGAPSLDLDKVFGVTTFELG